MNKILFLPHSQALSGILSKGRYQKDKGLAFYRNGARNVLFRLEALCRIGKTISDKKLFGKWYKEFKQLEDLLGDMDHHEAMLTEFAAVPQLASLTKVHLQKHLTLKTAQLTQVLSTQGWFSGEKLKEFELGLDKLEKVDHEKERKLIAQFLIDEMKELEDDYSDGKIDFTNLEEGLHEFRRDLRWFGIYGLVLEGWIQLRPVPVTEEHLQLYCTREIVGSPFNVLPQPMSGIQPIYVQSSYWYAMSWLIQHLGELKDIGLRFHVFNELSAKAKFKAKTDKASLTKKFLATCAYHPYELSTRAEMVVDKFLYRDRITKNIIRDIKRSVRNGEI